MTRGVATCAKCAAAPAASYPEVAMDVLLTVPDGTQPGGAVVELRTDPDYTQLDYGPSFSSSI